MNKVKHFFLMMLGAVLYWLLFCWMPVSWYLSRRSLFHWLLPWVGYYTERPESVGWFTPMEAFDDAPGEPVYVNPSCFKKQWGSEACHHNCPVSDECYQQQ